MNILIKKANKTLSIDWDAMPQNAKNFIIEYGLRQKLNDAGASATIKELGSDEAGKQAFAYAENMLAALMSGSIAVRSAKAGLTLEERIYSRVLRAVFKQVTGKKISTEVDVSNETLLEEISAKTGKPKEAIEKAIGKRVEAELVIERQKESIPDIDL